MLSDLTLYDKVMSINPFELTKIVIKSIGMSR